MSDEKSNPGNHKRPSTRGLSLVPDPKPVRNETVVAGPAVKNGTLVGTLTLRLDLAQGRDVPLEVVQDAFHIACAHIARKALPTTDPIQE